MSTKSSRGILPQDNLFRAVYALPSASEGIASERAVTQSDGGNTLELQWSVFDTWTEINSAFEGHFMERIAPGAFAKTIKENQPNMRILLQHGRDPQIGNKPIASITDVGENAIGGYATGELFPGLDPLVVDGLRAGQYGSSFRFGVIRDDLVTKPTRSAFNPKGIPERTIREANVQEFGPVTWGAYSAATAGVRSITDEIHFASLTSMPEDRLLELVAFARAEKPESERVDEGAWDGSAANYTDAQYESACALDRKTCGGDMADATAKTRCSLPYKTPDGTISRAGVHAAAGRISGVTDACASAIAEAKSKLRSAYATLGEDAPDDLAEGRALNLTGLAERVDVCDFNLIAEMILCGANYIAQQDEDDPQSNTDTMNQAISLLSKLAQVEIAEAPEPGDSPYTEYFYSAPESGETADIPETDDSCRTEAPEEAAPVEAPAIQATPTTDMYLSKRRRPERWRI